MHKKFEVPNEPLQERKNGLNGEFIDETFVKSPFTADTPNERRFRDGKPAAWLRSLESLPDMSKAEPFCGEVDPIGILPWNRKK